MKTCKFHTLSLMLFAAVLPHIGLCQIKTPQTRQPAIDLRSVQSYPRVGYSTPDPPEVDAAIRRLMAEYNRLQREATEKIRLGDLAGAECSISAASAADPLIGGRKVNQNYLSLLMGDIRRLQGRYKEALGYYLPTLKNTARIGLDIDIALCYVRTKKYAEASRYYSDKMLLRYSGTVTPADLPGTSTHKSLEASILMAHGIDKFLTSRVTEAFADLDSAGKLAPTNGVIPYMAGKALLELERGEESAPYFDKAARHANASIAHDAKQHLEGLKAWRMLKEREAAQKKPLLTQSK